MEHNFTAGLFGDKWKCISKLTIINLKGSKDLSDKKLWNKFLVAIANGITAYAALWEIHTWH